MSYRAPIMTVVLLALHAAASGGEAPLARRYQNNNAFLIGLGELDPDTRDVVLETYDWTVRGWVACGQFFIRREGDSAVDGGITFRARREGQYPLRSIARDRAGNTQEKGVGPDAADVVAVYDVTPPVIDIVAPERAVTVEPGGDCLLAWRTREANPLKTGSVSIDLTWDRGRTWRQFGSRVDDDGHLRFRVPDHEGGAVARITVWDRCGNRGEALFPELVIRRSLPGADAQSAADEMEAAAVGTSAPVAAADPQAAARAKRYYDRGAAALVAGGFARAAALLRKATAEDPGLREAWLDLSVALAKSEKLGAARDALLSAERRFARDAAFPYNRGLVLVRMGRNTDAKAALRRACYLDPVHVGAHWLLARLSIDSGDLATARACWRVVAKHSPAGSKAGDRARKYLEASNP